MKLKLFFEKFDLFADSPDAVAKLRELVLRMATSGRLTEQNPYDQPGGELIKEIFAVRDKLIKQGTVRNRVEGNPIAAGDTIDLPPSWSRCMISEVCDLQTGATPSRTDHSYFGGDIPWLVSGDINQREITDCDGRITRKGMENSNCKIIPANSVLIALNGQGKTRATVAVLRIHAALNQSLVAMIPYSGALLLPEYIFWNLRGRYFAIRDITGQDQRRGLNMKLVGQLSLPIPPVAEQKRIVAKVDELMALCDRLEAQQQERASRERALARASLSRFADAPTSASLNFLFHKSYTIPPADLRKSILTLAVQGKLVPHNTEPTYGSLESILAEASVNGVSTGPTFDKSATEILRISAGTSRNDFYVSEGDFKHVDLPLNEVEKFQLAPGDLLACRFNGNLHYVGRFSYYKGESGRVQVNPDKLIRFRIQTKSHCPRYVCLAMNAPPTREKIEAMCATTAGNIGLSAGRLKTVEIPLPPLAEQRRIVAKVEQLMALVDALEQQLAASRATAEKLLSSLVAELTVSPSKPLTAA